MKKWLLFFFLIIANVNLVYGQIIAGSTASGLVISNPAVSLTVTAIFGSASKTFDLDCDSIADMRVDIHKGATAIDGSNNAFLYILNPTFQVCADTGIMSYRFVNYFNLADTIACPLDANWYNDSIMQLGNYGCMECYGPFFVTDLYLGYKNTSTSQIGWIKISFNLYDGGSSVVPITLSIPEILSPCITTSITPAPTYTSSGVATCGPFTYNYLTYSPSCPGNCDGGVLVSNITGGTPGYYYQWSMGVVSSSVTNICAGAYMFNITDAVGNICTANFLVSDPAPMTFSLSSTNVSCYGAFDGTVCCANLTGGNPPYSFMWLPFMNYTSCMNNVPAGNYSLCVTDANGCQVCNGATVIEQQPITFSLSVTNVSCNGLSDGSICHTPVMGGTPGYVFTWSPSGSTSPNCSNNLSSGNYTFCVTDTHGCQVCSSAVVNEPSSIQVIESITQASCASCCDGISQLQIGGGTPPYSTVYTNTPSCPGVYGYTVTDSNGCLYVDSVLISYPTTLAELNFETMFDVFPNPSKGNFEIKNLRPTYLISKIKVVDVFGKCVFAKTVEINEKLIQLNLNIANGIYFLHISESSGTKELIKKIIILQ